MTSKDAGAMEHEIYLEYAALSIDTSAFERYGLRIESGLFAKLAQFRHGQAHVILSEIVERELVSHLEKVIREAQEKIKIAAKASLDNLLAGQEAVEEAKKTLLGTGDSSKIATMRVKRFIENCAAQVISL